MLFDTGFDFGDKVQFVNSKGDTVRFTISQLCVYATCKGYSVFYKGDNLRDYVKDERLTRVK